MNSALIRHFHRTKRVGSAVLLLLLLLMAHGYAQHEKPEPLDVFDSALAKFRADRLALRQWQYHQTLTTHQYNSAGEVGAKGTWRSIVRPGDPRPLEYTFEKVEGKLSFFKAEKPQPSAGAVTARAAPSTELKEDNPTESTVSAVLKYNLRDRYHWRLLANEKVAGESAYVLSFSPKPKQNTRSREERFFALLAGRVWVSRSDFTVLKAEAALQAPSHLFWVIARVRTFELIYELEPAAPKRRLLRGSKATVKTVVAFPFYEVRQRHWLTAGEFEPRTERGSGSKPATPDAPPAR